MTGDNYYDACRVFGKACVYGNVAEICSNMPNSVPDRTQWYTEPEIVNSAFSCELFMKSLLIYKGFNLEEIRKIGHGLKGLWGTVYNEYDELETVKVAMTELYETDTDDFNSLLLNISDAFTKWRYIYEGHGGKIHLGFLRDVQKQLKEICCMILYKRTWEEYSNSKK